MDILGEFAPVIRNHDGFGEENAGSGVWGSTVSFLISGLGHLKVFYGYSIYSTLILLKITYKLRPETSFTFSLKSFSTVSVGVTETMFANLLLFRCGMKNFAECASLCS